MLGSIRDWKAEYAARKAAEQAATMEKISQLELRELFGDNMPMEAVQVVFGAPPERTVGEIRAELREIAARYTAAVLADEFEPRIPLDLRWYERQADGDDVMFSWTRGTLHAVLSVDKGSRGIGYAYMIGSKPAVPGDNVDATIDAFPEDLAVVLRSVS